MSLLMSPIYRPATRGLRPWNGASGAPSAWDAVESVFDSIASPLVRDEAEGKAGVFAPPVEIVHDRDEIAVYAELPGVKKDDVEITVQDNSLTIKGTKKSEVERKEDRYQYVERKFGEFFRTFQLPAFVDATKVTADYADGVLKIHMPIAEQARPRRVQIDMKA